MKQITAIPVIVFTMLAAGCGQKQQVKVTFLSDPPGGMLYTQDGDLKGACPMELWYEVDQEAAHRGYLGAEGMEVRWPSGPAKKSQGQIRITVNGTSRRVMFVQPDDESTDYAEVATSPTSAIQGGGRDEFELPNVTGIQNADTMNVRQVETVTAPAVENKAVASEESAESEKPVKPETTLVAIGPPEPNKTVLPEKTLTPAEPVVPEMTSSADASEKTESAVKTVTPEKPVISVRTLAAGTQQTPEKPLAAEEPLVVERTAPPEKPVVSENVLAAGAPPAPEKPAVSERTLAAGTPPTPERPLTTEATVGASPGKSVAPVNTLVRRRPERVLTLSEEQLVLLDWHSSNRTGARVEGSRPVDGPGVEFDILFPSNNPGFCSLSFVSTGGGGRGALVGTDVRNYDAFALKLTLVSINGRTTPEPKQELVAGAVIGPTPEGRLTGYQPFKLSLAAPERIVTAKTRVATEEIYEIGFHIHAVKYDQWNPSGSRIVLRVEPAGDQRVWASNPPKR